MDSKLHIVEQLTSLETDAHFNAMVEAVYAHQLEFNAPFRTFVHGLIGSAAFSHDHPPFVPVELWKHHVFSCASEHQGVFKSSGTTGAERSEHHVSDLGWYRTLAVHHFESLYGPLADQVILALLPSYLENGDSSLVYMVETFAQQADPRSAFLMKQPDELKEALTTLKSAGQRTTLIGVSYALLDLVDGWSIDFPELTVMETGGMKGRKRELTRNELHTTLRVGFPSSPIHSEYGMTELLSQGYMMNGSAFIPPKWMRAYATEISDPMRIMPQGQRGLLAFIDLANVNSCAFVQTRDIGIVYPDGTFSVEGRLDHSDLRGCNLLYT